MRMTPPTTKLALFVILGVLFATILIAIITTVVGSQLALS
tara:strand:+ start:41 stop:160 length:120 start_codon:yes stop_codon:yes gene_type:complete